MPDQRLIDIWGRLEVEWRDAFEHAAKRQRDYDMKMTNHLIYHKAAPSLGEQEQIDALWASAAEKRHAADMFIKQHHG